MLDGVRFGAYYSFSGGFGLVNGQRDEGWYPYHVQRLVGRNLDPGDPIVRVTCGASDLRAVSWIHDQTVNTLVVSTSTQPQTVRFGGLQGLLQVAKIDESIPHTSPAIQRSAIDAADPLDLHGLAVALVQASVGAPR